MLDVKRLRILREVAAEGSFSAAADALHLTQSAVSQQIATLERETGTTLVERNGGRIRLTDSGTSLVSHAEAVMTRLEEAERELSEIAGLQAGKVRMVGFPTAGATLMVEAVRAFGKRYPEIELHLSEAEPEDSIPQLRAGEYDLALVYDFEYVPLAEDRDLERRFLLEERMQVGLPKDHPLAGRRKVRLDQLAEETWIVGTCSASCRDNALLACKQAGFDARVGFESDDYQVHQALVSAGMGVSLLPELLLTGRHPKLQVVDIVPSPPLRRTWALTRAKGARAPATDALLELLEAEGKRLAASGSG